MFGLGFPEIVVILFLVLLLFGPKRLPDLARAFGKGIGEFKNAIRDAENSIKSSPSLTETSAKASVAESIKEKSSSPNQQPPV